MAAPWLPHVEVLKIHEQSVKCGLQTKRDLLLGGLPDAYTASLPDVADPSGQLLSDLQKMNSSPPITGNVIPLEVWLTNAAYHATLYEDIRKFFIGCSDQIANKGHEEAAAAVVPEAPSAPDMDLATVNEREIFTNDLLPIGFLARAQTISRSVARLLVTSMENGQPRLSLTGRPRRYLGTGWLIGKSHIITNHHVVNARDDNEADASAADFKLQGEKTIVQFDFDSDNAAPDEKTVAEMAHANKTLDYAILKLSENPGRQPVPLWPQEVTLPANQVIPVNIIQHPGGAPKQIGMRNNLVARLTDRDLAYFTDTKGGSSGSPVCNDGWQVVALHKAATRTFGQIEFQGRKTEWVNIGTRIDKITEDLKTNKPDLWNAVEADI